MHCRNCDYELWNITSRECPECGTPFLPSEYTFYPNAVEFRCPHCAQPYFGTDARGHLDPTMFECVSCARPVTMDTMILAPAQGVDPRRASPIKGNPWLQRQHLGRRRAWWQTVKMGHVQPGQLARGTPAESPAWDAWKFALLNIAIVGVVGAVLTIVMLGVMFFFISGAGGGGGPGGPGLGAMFVGQAVGQIVLQFAIPLAYVAVWIGVTHLILMMIGAASARISGTTHALLYTSGTHLLSLVPCVSNFAWIWWIVSSIIALKNTHSTTGGKASLAVLTFPVTLITLLVVGYGLFIYFMIAAAGGFTPPPGATITAPSMTETRLVTKAMLEHEDLHGVPIAHATRLLDQPGFSPASFVTNFTMTTTDDVPLQPVTLPVDVVAHRMGDFVFTHHGFSSQLDPDLWIVVLSPDPDANPNAANAYSDVYVGEASGDITLIPSWRFQTDLTAQNTLRAVYDLPPLPDPSTITHDAPATASP